MIDNLTYRLKSLEMNDGSWKNALGMKFNLIQPGIFQMGSPESESRRFGDEALHWVEISTGFYLSIYLTTQAEWRAVMGDNPSKHAESKMQPVENVSWYDCDIFVNKLNSDEYALELKNFLGPQWIYSLPTESQWEYACRAGTQTAYFWGDKPVLANANYGRNLSGKGQNRSAGNKALTQTTSVVGAFKANHWGIYDMSGNVCEWTKDFYGDYPTERQINPQGPESGIEHVARGGSWKSSAENCRSACRFNFLSTFRGDNCGLRVAIIRKDCP